MPSLLLYVFSNTESNDYSVVPCGEPIVLMPAQPTSEVDVTGTSDRVLESTEVLLLRLEPATVTQVAVDAAENIFFQNAVIEILDTTGNN